jgi:hypothetical protein
MKMQEGEKEMEREKKSIAYKVQKGNRPKIEDVIACCLDGDLRIAAIDFAVWMRENKMPFKLNTSTTRSQRADYNGDRICHILVYDDEVDFNHVDRHYPGDPQYWSVSPCLWHWEEYEEVIVSEEWHSIFWDNMRYCNNCGSKGRDAGKIPQQPCAGGVSKTFFGKDFTGLCKNSTPAFTTIRNPDDAAVKAIKRLIELEQKARDEIK